MNDHFNQDNKDDQSNFDDDHGSESQHGHQTDPNRKKHRPQNVKLNKELHLETDKANTPSGTCCFK